MQVLARLIPGLDTTQRLTKNLIVDESIRELEQQQNRYMAAIQNIQSLMAENERLSIVIDSLRSPTVNACASLRNAGICADTRPQTRDFRIGTENNWLCETGSMYGLTESVDADIVTTAVQSDFCPDVEEQSLQSFVRTHSIGGGYDMQDYQNSSVDSSTFDSYTGMYVSDSWLSEDCLCSSSQSIYPLGGSHGPCC